MKLESFIRIGGIAALLFGAAAYAQPADQMQKIEPTSRYTAGKAPTSRMAKSDRALLNRQDDERIPILVKLDHDPIATYAGDVSGFAATSPAVTGKRLRDSSAEQRYEEYLAQRERRFLDKLPGVEVRQRLRTVYGGVALTLPANQVKQLLSIDGVVAVQRDEMRQPLTDSSLQFIGADKLTKPDARAGKGVIVGILDTGAWPEHPSFADQGNLGTPPGKKLKCDFGQGFKCNNKVIGGSAFLESYLSVNSGEKFLTARDSDGHGTHTGSTSAGNVVKHAKVFGIDHGPISGVAPSAWVSVYKVCGAKGCMSSDSAAAVAQAVRDGVDVINFSISGGMDPFSDPVEMAFLDAYAAGVFVAASAGNSGPDAGTVNHLSPWVTTVAASTQRRAFESTLKLSNGKTFAGASIGKGVGPAGIARGGKCDKDLKNVKNKIVVCERGGNARVDKSWRAKQGGAVGVILYNPKLQDVETDNHWLPTIHLADNKVLSALDGASTATISASSPANGKGDVMAAFSSRGPGGLALKPDVTAPGVQILAGHTPEPDEATAGPPGELFQAIAGTSMSSPHVAGAAALLMARHPGWTPGQVKSALMTTAVTDVLKEDLKTKAGPLDLGSGRIAVDRAANPGVTISETAANMLAKADDEVTSVHLNLPSVNAPVMPGRLSTKRVLTNVSGRPQAYRVLTDSPKGSAITAYPQVLTIMAGEKATLTVTISSGAVSDEFMFGQVRLEPMADGVPALHLPVAFRPVQGQVTLSAKCAAVTVAIGETTDCQVKVVNNGYSASTVDLRASGSPSLRADASWKATLAGVTPGVPQVSTLDGRRFRKLDVPADAIGDEEILNYKVPSFTYAGRSYDQIGVVSNGYVVVGGGTIQDVRYEAPTGVTADRPNNVLAPFWADLDGTTDEGVRVSTISRDWTVVEWRVKRYGTEEKQRFQLWIGAAGIHFTYSSVSGQAGVGAENALGKGTLEGRAPKTDFAVTSSGGKPGDTLTYTVPVRLIAPRNGTLTVSMTTPEVPGTTVVKTPVRVDSER